MREEIAVRAQYVFEVHQCLQQANADNMLSVLNLELLTESILVQWSKCAGAKHYTQKVHARLSFLNGETCTESL